jgi:hypothetical protein
MPERVLKAVRAWEWSVMDEAARHKLIWGWLRLFLGFAQMSLVAMGVGVFLTVGLHWITYVFVIAATVATIISRLLYRGKSDPELEPEKKSQPLTNHGE